MVQWAPECTKSQYSQIFSVIIPATGRFRKGTAGDTRKRQGTTPSAQQHRSHKRGTCCHSETSILLQQNAYCATFITYEKLLQDVSDALILVKCTKFAHINVCNFQKYKRCTSNPFTRRQWKGGREKDRWLVRDGYWEGKKGQRVQRKKSEGKGKGPSFI